VEKTEFIGTINQMRQPWRGSGILGACFQFTNEICNVCTINEVTIVNGSKILTKQQQEQEHFQRLGLLIAFGSGILIWTIIILFFINIIQ
jgi:hypothetical protein